jgi:hypothetical protein
VSPYDSGPYDYDNVTEGLFDAPPTLCAGPTTFALAIPHAPWKPERAPSLTRLVDGLSPAPSSMVARRVFADREPNWSWSEKLWAWSAETGASHLLQLQDDVIVGPDFWPQLTAMVDAVSDQVIGLESVLAMGSPWYTTSDGLIGVGYLLPRQVTVELLHWRKTALRAEGYKRLNEDQLIGLFCFVTGRRIWHPVPTLIDHDIDLASTYGNDAHSHRRPAKSTVRGDRAPESWRVTSKPPYLGKFYGATPYMARQHVKGYSYERYLDDERAP